MPSSRSNAPHHNGDADTAPGRVSVPADIGAPDQIAWGLSFRQLAILAAAGTALWSAYSRFGALLPPLVWVAVAILTLAVAATVTLGRRDGLPLDVWLRHGLALRATRPGIAAPGTPAPGRPVARVEPRPAVPAPLRTGVTRIADDGTLTVDGATRSVLACGTTSVALRTGTEQAGLLDGFGRWLNALPGPAQVVVSAARHDLTPYAQLVADDAARLSSEALRAAAVDYARFLLHLDADREPLRRQVLAVVPATGASDAVRALGGLGITVDSLDAGQVTAALAAAVDPYDPPVPGPRATPGVPVTAPSARARAAAAPVRVSQLLPQDAALAGWTRGPQDVVTDRRTP